MTDDVKLTIEKSDLLILDIGAGPHPKPDSTERMDIHQYHRGGAHHADCQRHHLYTSEVFHTRLRRLQLPQPDRGTHIPHRLTGACTGALCTNAKVLTPGFSYLNYGTSSNSLRRTLSWRLIAFAVISTYINSVCSSSLKFISAAAFFQIV